MSACADLVDTAARIAAVSPSPRTFLLQLGVEAGGVRRGPRWLLDAGRGGRNRLPGGGFRGHIDDGTAGQARHFAGIVAVATRIGPALTRWLSIHLGRDAPDTADGRLTDHALDFVRRTLDGRLSPSEAPAWIRMHLCDEAVTRAASRDSRPRPSLYCVVPARRGEHNERISKEAH